MTTKAGAGRRQPAVYQSMADHQARNLVQGSLGRVPGQDNSSGFGNMVNQGANE